MTKLTITDERLAELVAFKPLPGTDITSATRDEWMAMAAELQERRKAAMDSEPVAEVCEDYAIRYISSGPAPKEGLHPGDKLYRHAQQPVVPEEMTAGIAVKHWQGGRGSIESFVAGCNFFRAAMLNGGNDE